MGLSIRPKVNATPQTYIVGIEVYKNDVRVIRRMKNHQAMQDKERQWYETPEGEIFVTENLRQPISKLSRKGQKSLAFTASNTDIEFRAMITLTYPADFPMDGKKCKRHLHAFLAYMRRNGIVDYLWFLEFQQRGAPHYHVLIADDRKLCKNDVSTRWFEIVGSGDDRHLRAGTRIDRAKKRNGLHNYCVKYAQKARQKNVPDGFRNVGAFWNCSNSVRPNAKSRWLVNDEQALSELLAGWKYEGKEKNKYSVLFNASSTVLSSLDRMGLNQESE